MKLDDTHDELDDFLKESFSEHTIQPEDELWNWLNTKIPSRGVISLNKYRKLKIAFYSSVASIAALILLFGSYYFFHTTKQFAISEKVNITGSRSVPIVSNSSDSVPVLINQPKNKFDKSILKSTKQIDSIKKVDIQQKREKIRIPTTKPENNSNEILLASIERQNIKLLPDHEPYLNLVAIENKPLAINKPDGFTNPTGLIIEKESVKEKRTASKLNYEIHAIPQATSQLFPQADDFEIAGSQSTDSWAFTFSGGINVGFRLTPKITLSTGINASQYKKALELNPLTFTVLSENQVETSTIIGVARLYYPNLNSTSTEPIDVTLNLWYGEIPLKAGYNLSEKIELETGILYRRLFSTQLDFKTDDVQEMSVESIAGLRKNNWGISLGINYQNSFSERLTLKVGPEINYLFSSISSLTEQNIYPYSLGLKVSLTFN